MVFANTETSFALRSPLASNRSVTESDSREIFEGLNLSYKEAFAIAQKYPHLEMRFMLPAKGDIVTEFINLNLLGLGIEELELIANRFVVGPNISYKSLLDQFSVAYPCFQVYSHARKPYFILPGDGIVVDTPEGGKKRIRYIGYLGGGLVFSQDERNRRFYTRDADDVLIDETFGVEFFNGTNTNMGLYNGGLANRRLAFLKEMYDKGEPGVPMFLLLTKLETLRDMWGGEVLISELEAGNKIIPRQAPSIAIMGYEGLETMRDLDLMPSYFLEGVIERNRTQAQEKEGRSAPFTNEEFLLWFSEKFANRLARLINLGIFRGNLSPQNVTFFEITDFDVAQVYRIESYDDVELWDDVLFVNFFQGYVTLMSTFKLFSEKLGVDKDIEEDIKKIYFKSILERLDDKERVALMQAVLRNRDIEEDKAALYFKPCDSNYKMLQEFLKGFAISFDVLKQASEIPRQQL